MRYKITLTYQGGRQHHIANPLNCLDGREYATREEACEAIYERMYDVIDGETGCEMVDRPTDEINCEDDETSNDRQSAYIDACHAYIIREGYATEDGVTATVDEYDPEGINLMTSTPVYVDNYDCNLLTLTPYLRNDGELWMASRGSGSGDDEMIEDVYGWSDDEILSKYEDIDIDAMRSDADEIADVDHDAADWLRAWCDRVAAAQESDNADNAQ